MAAPTLLLLDEPMAGVNPALREELLRHMASLRDQGMTILLIEHDMDAVARISDWVVCLAEGTIIAEGSVEEVRSNPAVIDAYLGRGRTDRIGRGERRRRRTAGGRGLRGPRPRRRLLAGH